MASFIEMATYREPSKKTVRNWIESLDKATLAYLYNRLHKQKKVIKRNGKIVKIIYFGDVINMLQYESGVISSALTRSEYISHEASDIVMRALLGILEDKHLDREPDYPIYFQEFEHFLLNDVAGSQLFHTNEHAQRYKFGSESVRDSDKQAIRHINISDADTLRQHEEDLAQNLGIYNDLLLEIEDLRKLIKERSIDLLKVFDLSLENYSVKEITQIMKRSKSKIYADINQIKGLIHEYQSIELCV